MFVCTIIICWQHKTNGFCLVFKLNGHLNQTESFAKLLWLVDLRPTTLIAMQYNLYVRVILTNILTLRYALALDDYHKRFQHIIRFSFSKIRTQKTFYLRNEISNTSYEHWWRMQARMKLKHYYIPSRVEVSKLWGVSINLCLIAPHIVPQTTFSKRIRANLNWSCKISTT